MTSTEARERVARGVALLDAHEPTWASRIDVGILNLAGCSKCILGQLTGDYGDGLERFVPGGGGGHPFGFALLCGQDYAQMWDDSFHAGYRLLQDAWIEAIADRLVESATSSTQTEQVQEALSVVSSH